MLGEANAHLAADALEAHRRRYLEIGMFENTLYPGIPEALQALSKRARLFIATSKPAEFAIKIAKHFNVDGYFLRIYGSEMNGVNSDKGELINVILTREKLDTEETFMIGDRKHDMIGAAKNKIKGVGVGWGYGTADELLASGAAAVMNSPSDLQKYLLDFL